MNSQLTMPPTATRNSAVVTGNRKQDGSIAGLLTPTTSTGYTTGGALTAPNGTSQFSNMHTGQYPVSDTNTVKPTPPVKNTTPMTGISAGLASRGSGKGARASGAGGTGPKR